MNCLTGYSWLGLAGTDDQGCGSSCSGIAFPVAVRLVVIGYDSHVGSEYGPLGWPVNRPALLPHVLTAQVLPARRDLERADEGARHTGPSIPMSYTPQGSYVHGAIGRFVRTANQ
jgi:hypothetical protein